MTPEIPIYKLIVNDEEEIGISYVALVDKPATGELWIAFKEQNPIAIEFKTVSEEKRMVMGALMVANLPIPRVNEKNELYRVVLDAANIDKAMYKLAKKGNQSNVNLMHDALVWVGCAALLLLGLATNFMEESYVSVAVFGVFLLVALNVARKWLRGPG